MVRYGAYIQTRASADPPGPIDAKQLRTAINATRSKAGGLMGGLLNCSNYSLMLALLDFVTFFTYVSDVVSGHTL